MSDQESQTPSALQAWVSTVMAGGDDTHPEQADAVDRTPSHAHNDPADVISFYMSARESAKDRLAPPSRPASTTRPNQPS